MPYRDEVTALEIKLRGLRDARRELDASIAETRRELRRGRIRRLRRPWSWEVLAGVLTLLAFCLVAAAFVPMALCIDCCGVTREDSTRWTARTIRSAAQLHLARGGACPSVAALVDRGVLDQDQALTDSWGNPFRVECAGGRVIVRSAGPDGRWGHDDIDSHQVHGARSGAEQAHEARDD